MSQRMEFKWCSLYQSDQAFLVGGVVQEVQRSGNWVEFPGRLL